MIETIRCSWNSSKYPNYVFLVYIHKLSCVNKRSIYFVHVFISFTNIIVLFALTIIMHKLSCSHKLLSSLQKKDIFLFAQDNLICTSNYFAQDYIVQIKIWQPLWKARTIRPQLEKHLTNVAIVWKSITYPKACTTCWYDLIHEMTFAGIILNPGLKTNTTQFACEIIHRLRRHGDELP